MKKKNSSLGIGRRRVLKGAALVCSAALTPQLAANAQVLPKVPLPMSDNSPGHATNDLTADEIRKLLQLEPNATCGYVRVTYESTQSIAAGVLPAPFAEKRPLGSGVVLHGDAGRARSAAPHPQRATLPLLSRRPA